MLSCSSVLLEVYATELWLQDAPDWQEILTYFRGSELQNYFTRILEDDLHAIIKPQYVDHIPKAVRGNVEEVLIQKDGRGQREHLQKVLELEQVLDRDVEHLSGTCPAAVMPSIGILCIAEVMHALGKLCTLMSRWTHIVSIVCAC